MIFLEADLFGPASCYSLKKKHDFHRWIFHIIESILGVSLITKSSSFLFLYGAQIRQDKPTRMKGGGESEERTVFVVLSYAGFGFWIHVDCDLMLTNNSDRAYDAHSRFKYILRWALVYQSKNSLKNI